MNKLFVCIGCVLALAHGTAPSHVRIDPENPFVWPKHNVSILCQAEHPLKYCRIKLHGYKNALILSPEMRPSKEFTYFGTSLEQGQCGITLFNVQDKVNGLIECTPLPDTGTVEETSASTTVTVVRRPKNPELIVVDGQSGLRKSIFEEGSILKATCSVRDGRPLANITWFLGDDVIQNGLSNLVHTDGITDLRSITQTIMRPLTWKDNTKLLSCVAGHLAFDPAVVAAEKRLNVTYSPKSMAKSIEVYGLSLNKTQNITVEIFANPPPSFVWIISKTIKLSEGQHDREGKFIAQWPQYLGQDKWKVVLSVQRLTTADIGRQYQLSAKNSAGEKLFSVVVSTDDGPSFKLGIGSMILIAIGGVCVLTFGVILYITFSQRRKRKLVIEPTHTEKITQLKVDT